MIDDIREKQRQYEEDADSAAAAERLLYLQQQAQDGDVELPRAQKFIARAYGQVKANIEAQCAVQTRGVGGKFKNWLRKVPSEVAAVVALRICILALTSHRRDADSTIGIQMLASVIGRIYEMEVKIREAETVNPMYMQRIHAQVKENNTTSENHLHRLYSVAYERVMKGEMDSGLTAVEQVNLGKLGLQAVVDAGIVEVRQMRTKVGLVNYFELSADVSEFLQEYTKHDVTGVLSHTHGAMMCPPDDWTTLHDGGYISERRRMNQPLMSLGSVRKSERKRLRNEVFRADKMPQVFEAANYLQGRAFALHGPTLAAVKRVWAEGGGTMGIPLRTGPVKPAFPLASTWVKADATDAELKVFSAWKQRCVQYYVELRAWRGRAREIGGFIKIAEQSFPTIYFPVFCDKRGRWYYRGAPNPQGSDIAKACLHFANKKPLGAAGLFWLKVHVANCFGFDKARLKSRAAWTEQNWPMIQHALAEPENHPDVWGDSPWCMYSACYELAQALASGNPEAYETGVVVHMDATCSGLQHFSAMLRDPVGGKFVNLTNESGESKMDIYTKVACEVAMDAIRLDSLDSDPVKAKLALWWLDKGMSRALAKKPVMTYVYGATLHGTQNDIQIHMEAEYGSDCWPEGTKPFEAAVYGAKKLFQGIAAVVPAADAAMRWLRAVARSMPNGQRMEWTTPTGFKVQHDYQDFDEVRVFVRSCGITTAVVREYTEDTRAMPMQNAISPNFVHALDASHLTLTALRMRDAGLDMVGIHDSFGTHPCDVAVMQRSIREAFVELYKDRNVLSDFLWEVNGVGEVPMRGTLDITAVLDSEFFFC